jgi:hypothetical protein
MNSSGWIVDGDSVSVSGIDEEFKTFEAIEARKYTAFRMAFSANKKEWSRFINNGVYSS